MNAPGRVGWKELKSEKNGLRFRKCRRRRGRLDIKAFCRENWRVMKDDSMKTNAGGASSINAFKKLFK